MNCPEVIELTIDYRQWKHVKVPTLCSVCTRDLLQSGTVSWLLDLDITSKCQWNTYRFSTHCHDEIVLKLDIDPKTIQTYPEVPVEARISLLVPETYAVLQSEDEIVLKLGIDLRQYRLIPKCQWKHTYAVLQSEDEIVLKLGIEPKTIQTYPEVPVEARIRFQSTHCQPSEDEIVLKLDIDPKTIQTYPEVPVEAQLSRSASGSTYKVPKHSLPACLVPESYAVLQSEDEIVLKLDIDPKTIQTYPEVPVEARIRFQSTHCQPV
ncbi:hypothetical protein J6590_031297 [Homalodisca vitripennis]|nr:hypothetical protein J6590_031297 [Homalodisca vitripennis]